MRTATWVCLVTLSPAVLSASVLYFGSGADAAGDAFCPPLAGGCTTGNDDLVFASASVDSDSMLTLVVRFAASSFSPGLSVANFVFDLDKNPATGFAGTDSVHNESSIFGTDAGIDIPHFLNPYAAVLAWNGTTLITEPTQYAFTTLADGYEITLPLADLGTSSGLFNFKVLSGRGLTSTSQTAVEDRMTELNLPPISTSPVSQAIPEPASLSFVALGLCAMVAAVGQRACRAK